VQKNTITGKLKDILGRFHLRKYVDGRVEEELQAGRNRLSFHTYIANWPYIEAEV
jgi:hypothetical protein